MSTPSVPLRVARLSPRATLPSRAHAGDAGADLHAAEEITLAPGERALVGTGIALALEPGTVGLVHPRSGLAARHGITIVNAPGTIDAGYRGEVRVCLLNTDRSAPFTVRVGDRIAQLVVQRVELPPIEEVQDVTHLGTTDRGTGGHGSTGR
ncbi:dUTP diphosphatase [Kytococcus sedentarius]|uniref:dUTP diphosphatase n=1 Tax=Kytococcus sedentarius TaxID=1276 RepID=UPI00195083E1|nr:dUTP diphosphatase [Kytococcus sedentarius]QRO86491.1 dUTP diphosphatase [Kytococcus sedentarius]